MARPKKQGLDYFTNDVTFYQDIKIRKLIRHKGIQAVPVYHILLCQIYASGYYLSWDEDLPFIVSEASGLEEDEIQDIINYCISIGLFDKDTFEQHHVLTSCGIQERYMAFCAATKRKLPYDTPFLLVALKSNQINSEKTIVSSEEDDVNSEETPIIPAAADVNSEETPIEDEEDDINSEKTPVNSEKSTQSKVKERKDNKSLCDLLSPPPTPPTPACVREDGEASITAEQGVELLKHDRDWLLQMQRKFKMEACYIARWLDSFVIDCDCRGKQQHESLSDVKQHFNDWMLKNGKSKTGGQGQKSPAPQSMSPEKLWISCQAELCKSVSEDVSRQSFDLLSFGSFDAQEKALTIKVSSKETYDYIEENQVHLLYRVLVKYFGKDVKIKYFIPKLKTASV